MKGIFPIAAFAAALFAGVISGCKKEYDTPPERTIPTGNVLTIADLRAMYNGNSHRFVGDSSVYAVVTGDERSGNLYKNIYVQDGTGAINLRLLTSGGLYEGDSIRIYLKNCVLSQYRGMLQLDSVNVDENVVKQATGKSKTPRTVTIEELNADMQSQLIRLEDVQFSAMDAGQPFADAVNQQSLNRTLSDCSGNSVIVRTSGFASFAGVPTPTGKGELTAILTVFSNSATEPPTLQLVVRSLDDVKLDGDRCSRDSLRQNFNSSPTGDFTGGDWQNINTSGTFKWRVVEANGDKFVQMTAFNAPSNVVQTAWLITPGLKASPTKKLTFRSQAAFFTHEALEVLISSNYDGNNPAAATWYALPANLSHQNNVWVESGTIDLAPALPGGYTGIFHIAFKHTGMNPGQTGNSRIDDIVIRD